MPGLGRFMTPASPPAPAPVRGAHKAMSLDAPQLAHGRLGEPHRHPGGPAGRDLELVTCHWTRRAAARGCRSTDRIAGHHGADADRVSDPGSEQSDPGHEPTHARRPWTPARADAVVPRLPVLLRRNPERDRHRRRAACHPRQPPVPHRRRHRRSGDDLALEIGAPSAGPGLLDHRGGHGPQRGRTASDGESAVQPAEDRLTTVSR